MVEAKWSCPSFVAEFSEVIASARAKFVESVDCAVVLGVNPKNSDENIRGVVLLPYSIGAPPTVAVFAKGEETKLAAERAGVAFVGSEDLISQVLSAKGSLCDCYVATPDIMPLVASKLARVLGPKGLMPNPKLGTVTADIESFVRSASKRIELRNDKGGVIHAKIGNVSMSPSVLSDNLVALLGELMQLRPKALKGRMIKRIFVSSTMGPSFCLGDGGSNK